MVGRHRVADASARAARRFLVREASPNDARRVAEIHVQAWEQTCRSIAEAGGLRAPSLEEQELRWGEHLALPTGDDHFVLVAEEQGSGDVIGFVAGGGSRDHDGKGDGEIYALYVDPRRWRLGIGALLLERTVSALGDASFASAAMWVLEADAAASAFCEAVGWAPDGQRRAAAAATGLDELRYRKSL